MKKIPKGAEASNILVGEVDFLEKPFSAFIRLQEAAILGDLTEVPVPTRFLFIMLGPCVSVAQCQTCKRCLSDRKGVTNITLKSVLIRWIEALLC